MKSILDPSFVYVNANSTDIRKTFERIREEMRQAQQPTPAPESLREEEVEGQWPQH